MLVQRITTHQTTASRKESSLNRTIFSGPGRFEVLISGFMRPLGPLPSCLLRWEFAVGKQTKFKKGEVSNSDCVFLSLL